MRRQFVLSEDDSQYLGSLSLPWETVKEAVPGAPSPTLWLMVHEWPIPTGYSHSTATAGLILPTNYPETQIDMVFFAPALSLKSGKAINNLTARRFDDKDWQQWSRHRTPSNPWRSDVDNIATHFLLVNHWLERELPRVAA